MNFPKVLNQYLAQIKGHLSNNKSRLKSPKTPLKLRPETNYRAKYNLIKVRKSLTILIGHFAHKYLLKIN